MNNRYMQFEIFNTEQEGNTKNNNINTLLGYPHQERGTTTYRNLIKKYEVDQWAGIVTTELINACKGMLSEEKILYYDENNLKSFQWLVDNQWFESIE